MDHQAAADKIYEGIKAALADEKKVEKLKKAYSGKSPTFVRENVFVGLRFHTAVVVSVA